MYSKEEIRQAVSAVQNGNISKWEVIDKAYRKKIEGYCAARSRNASEAEDLAPVTIGNTVFKPLFKVCRLMCWFIYAIARLFSFIYSSATAICSLLNFSKTEQ